jgi:hypothetical protein
MRNKNRLVMPKPAPGEECRATDRLAKDKRALRMTGALVPGHDPTQPPAHCAAVIKLQLFRHIKGKTLYSIVFFAG